MGYVMKTAGGSVVASKRAVPRVEPAVWHHPKVEKAAVRLGISPYQMVYHLHHLWVAASKSNGVVTTARPEDVQGDFSARIAKAANYTGDARRLAKTLLDQRLLEHRDDAALVHDWRQWNTDEQENKKQAVRTKDVSTAAEGGPQGDRYSQFIWWVTKGFGIPYAGNGIDGRGMKGAGALAPLLLAECYAAISSGRWGDDFDRRANSVSHAIKRANAYQSWKVRRRVVGTAIPLTDEGARYADDNGTTGRCVAGAANGEAAASNGASDPFAVREDDDGLDSHPKLFDE